MSMMVNSFRFGAANETGFSWPEIDPLDPHRYWRVYQRTSEGGGGIMALTECQFLDDTGTRLTGTLIPSGTDGGSMADLIDDNTSTFWYHFDINAYVYIDLGSGNDAIVDAVKLGARNTFWSQAPRDFDIQWSDDASTWTTVTSVDYTHWDSDVVKIFKVQPYIVRIQNVGNAAGGGTTITYTELEFHDSAGGTDITEAPSGSGDALAIRQGRILGRTDRNDGIYAAFDDNTGTYCGAEGGTSQYTEYRFDELPDIYEFKITPRGSPFHVQGPLGLKVQLSRDGITYVDAATFSPGAWDSLTPQTFVMPGANEHRFWRLLITESEGSAIAAIGELKMMNVPGGPQLATGGTATADSELSGSYSPDKAFAADGGTTFWHSANSSPPHWIAYEFPAYVEITALELTKRSDGYPETGPYDAQLQYSDDGASWTTAWRFVAQPWGANGVQTFAQLEHRWWRLLTNTNEANSDNHAIGELKMMSTSGGSQLATGGAAFADSILSGGYEAARAFAGDNGVTFWHSASTSPPHHIGYYFPTSVNISHLRITRRADGFYDTGVKDVDVQRSTDGINWVTVWSFTAGSWTSTIFQDFAQ